jgi:hypothetical protein
MRLRIQPAFSARECVRAETNSLINNVIYQLAHRTCRSSKEGWGGRGASGERESSRLTMEAEACPVFGYGAERDREVQVSPE